jgi:hypothetical protein
MKRIPLPDVVAFLGEGAPEISYTIKTERRV